MFKRNEHVHPRTYYKTRVQFQKLAIEFPEFREIAQQDIRGRISINFKDEEHLRVLNATLLRRDFGLDVYLAPGYLVPTIPLRLNYILWIEDILILINRSDSIYGIDIGTGASGVYMLMGAKKNKWNMVGTDIDTQSVIFAQENINRNNLDDLIKVILTKDDEPFFAFSMKDDQVYDFCMCNPPFYDYDRLGKNRTEHRPEPKNAPTGKSNEIVTKGGEEEFIGRIIDESKEMKTKIRVYTTMVGHKKTLLSLIDRLKSVEVKSYCVTDFFQGHTLRWGLAWTYCDYDLPKVYNCRQDVFVKAKKSLKPVVFTFAKNGRAFEQFIINLKFHFEQLEFSYIVLKSSLGLWSFQITAYKDLWTHQRRRKREHLRKNGNTISSKDSDKLTEEPEEKKIKLEPVISFTLTMKNELKGFTMIILRTDEVHSNNFVCQIMQYFRNNLETIP